MTCRTYIQTVDNDSLLQIFSCYRLADEDSWNHRHEWRNLAHVCRRWRYLVFSAWTLLDMCILLSKDSPSLDTLSHLPPLPLAIDYSDGNKAVTWKDQANIHLGLQHHGRVRQVALRAPSSSLRTWFEPMDKVFPRLTDLYLSSTTMQEINLTLPETLQAPDLRHLSLHGIGLPRGPSLLSSMIALSTLDLTHFGASCYISPGHLVTLLQGLPYLEELSIGFATPIPLPGSEGELLPAPIPPVTLPSLRQLTFRGVDIYLDNLVAQINTLLLERLSLTFFFDLVFSLENLTEFILRTEGFGCLFALVFFNEDGASIDMGSHERGIGKLSIHVDCEPLDWQLDSAAQVCIALGKALSTIEDLTLDLDVDRMPSNWENTLDDMMWHELLLPFIGVKKLYIGFSLTLQLSQALQSDAGGLVLPELQELKVPHRIECATKALSMLINTRESMGRPIHLLVSEDQIKAKHLQNTLALRRRRRRKLKYGQVLESALDVERIDKEMWQARTLALEGQLRDESQNWESVGHPERLLDFPEDEVTVGPSLSEDIMRAKRFQNSIAKWNSRGRIIELEVAIDIEHKEKELWKARALALEGQLRDKSELKGLDVSFSEPFSTTSVSP